MNAAEIRAYARRWQLVNEAERAELRATPPSRKFAQLAALMRSAIALGWQTNTAEEVEAVRQRWNRLRSLYDRD